METPKIVYVRKYNIFIRADKWQQAKDASKKARQKPANPSIRDPQEVAIFEQDLKNRPKVTE